MTLKLLSRGLSCPVILHVPTQLPTIFPNTYFTHSHERVKIQYKRHAIKSTLPLINCLLVLRFSSLETRAIASFLGNINIAFWNILLYALFFSTLKQSKKYWKASPTVKNYFFPWIIWDEVANIMSHHPWLYFPKTGSFYITTRQSSNTGNQQCYRTII